MARKTRKIIRFYIIGLCILITAILVNALIMQMELKSWYDLFSLLHTHGAQAFQKLNFFDYLWLFVAYPLVLGCGGMFGDYVSKIIFK